MLLPKLGLRFWAIICDKINDDTSMTVPILMHCFRRPAALLIHLPLTSHGPWFWEGNILAYIDGDSRRVDLVPIHWQVVVC